MEGSIGSGFARVGVEQHRVGTHACETAVSDDLRDSEAVQSKRDQPNDPMLGAEENSCLAAWLLSPTRFEISFESIPMPVSVTENRRSVCLSIERRDQ